MKLASLNLQKRLVSAVILDLIVTAFVLLLFFDSPDRTVVVFSSFVILQLVPLFFLMKDLVVKIVLFRLEKDEVRKNFLSLFRRFDFPAPEKLDEPADNYLRDVTDAVEENAEAALEAARLKGYLEAASSLGGPQLRNHLYRGLQDAMNQYYNSRDDDDEDA